MEGHGDQTTILGTRNGKELPGDNDLKKERGARKTKLSRQSTTVYCS